jgi:hypothetical protein
MKLRNTLSTSLCIIIIIIIIIIITTTTTTIDKTALFEP